MDIGVPFRDLGPVDMTALAEKTLAQEPAAWLEHELRQRKYDVHHDTHSIVLVFCDGRWPDPNVTREPGWARLADVAQPLMDSIIAAHYLPGGTIIRAMAARLEVGGTIKPHTDAQESFVRTHRIHIPLTSNSGVRFTVDGRPCPMKPGRVYEINNQKTHSVMNRGKEPRISFIFDYFPPPAARREG
ncbi:MAG TPA: aspartyl/asparaginyl beta-hydroxylase domain-containing protein [Steroidobacteraceae bacterium]|nr:aspartyl/asparaginyl beta-hydroxylase domain-containing protein [Steroidobacteraceae bacterium]